MRGKRAGGCLIICSSASLSWKNGRAWNYYIPGGLLRLLAAASCLYNLREMEFSAERSRGIPDREALLKRISFITMIPLALFCDRMPREKFTSPRSSDE